MQGGVDRIRANGLSIYALMCWKKAREMIEDEDEEEDEEEDEDD